MNTLVSGSHDELRTATLWIDIKSRKSKQQLRNRVFFSKQLLKLKDKSSVPTKNQLTRQCNANIHQSRTPIDCLRADGRAINIVNLPSLWAVPRSGHA